VLQGWFILQEFGEGSLGRGHVLFLMGPAGHAPWQTGWALQWALYRLGAHRGASGQCADTIQHALVLNGWHAYYTQL